MRLILILLFVVLIHPTKIFCNNNDSIRNVAELLINANELDELHTLVLDLSSINPELAAELAAELIDEAGNSEPRLKGLGYFDLAETMYYKDKYEDALSNYIIAERYFETIGDKEMIASCNSNSGLICLRLAHYKKSIDYYEKALSLEIELGNKLAQAKCYQNLGIILGNNNKFKLQQINYTKALDIYKELGDHMMIADISLNLGTILARQKKYKEAEAAYMSALDCYKRMENENRMASIYTNLGYLNIYIEDYNKSEYFFTNSISMFEEIDDKFGLIHAYQGLGDLFAAKGKKSEAIKMYLKCEDLNSTIGLLDIQASNLKGLSDAYRDMKDYESAIRILEKYYIARDSIFNTENTLKILDLDKKYQFQKNQSEISELKASIRLYLIILIVIIFVFMLGGAILYNKTRYNRLKDKERQLKLEQKVLRTQMNPHFIFNSLSAIQCYILENKVEDAVDFLADFASLIRMVLEYSQVEFITLKQEYDLLNFYLKLQNKRFGECISYEINIDKELMVSNIMIPPMLAQPFIENSFEHGELNRRDSGSIVVSLEKQNAHEMNLIILDNGVGLSSNNGRRKGHKSLATTITKERLKIINKNNSSKLELKVEDRAMYGEQGTRVAFSIPITLAN